MKELSGGYDNYINYYSELTIVESEPTIYQQNIEILMKEMLYLRLTIISQRLCHRATFS